MTGREPDDDQGVDVELLPHWARIALSARCARRVMPLFAQSWPAASPGRSQAILRAIELAEHSASAGRPLDGLEDAVTEATVTAGAALRSIYGFGSDEGAPKEKAPATVAAFIANAAGRSAKAASEAPSDSTRSAADAVSFAQNAASTAAAMTILVDIEHAFARLRRLAVRERWTDRTAVPPAVFEGH
jgi:hypothetical protein